MKKFETLQCVRYFDDDDELYCEFEIAFKYRGRFFAANNSYAYSGAWNDKSMAMLQEKEWNRLYAGSMELLGFEESPFEECELMKVADVIIENDLKELQYLDSGNATKEYKNYFSGKDWRW